MDTTVEPLVLKIKRAVEDAVGVPVRVLQNPDNTFGLVFLNELVTDPKTTED